MSHTRFPLRPARKILKAIVFVATFPFLSPGSPAQAASELRTQLAGTAKTVADFLKQRGEDRIAVGQFTGPSRMPSSSGPAIAQALSEALIAAGINVARRAPLEIKGDYLAIVDERRRGPAAVLKGRIFDDSGMVLLEFEQGFDKDATVASLFGLTLELPPDAGPRETKKLLRESIDQPKSHLASSKVGCGPTSPFAIEVLVKQGSEYVPRAPSDDDGLAFVSIAKDEIYAVRVHNDADHDVAVTLTIDGLNMFSFSENSQYRDMGVFVVGKKSSGTIYGWHRTNQASDSFLVTDYAKSAAAELKHTTGLGTITCSFAAAWAKGEPAPPGESTTRADVATGRGPEVKAEFREVERIFGRTRAAVSVRYDKPAAE